MTVNFLNNLKTYNTDISRVSFKRAANVSSPLNSASDSVKIRPFTEVANERLEKVYGIKSEISNPELLKDILSCVEDFAALNQDNDLFKGLELNEKSIDDELYVYESNYKTHEFKITFNSDYNHKHIEENTKRLYNKGCCGSDNPKYYLYKALGSYINFDYNPYAFTKNSRIHLDENTYITTSRISDASDFSTFNAEYIATKMCGVYTPEILDDYFEERAGNINLKFPKSECPLPPVYKEQPFDTIEKAQEHLKTEYGIDSEFDNLRYANDCVKAVEELTEAIGDKTIFSELKIVNEPEAFDDTLCYALTHWNANTGEAVIKTNPAYNIKNIDRTEQKNYNKGFHPSNDIKNNLFIHELSHYLDFKGNPLKYSKTENDFKSGKTYFNDYGLAITGKVGIYAAKSSSEFCAEYISGRFAGIKYPKAVNDEFYARWNGPDIKFPD